MKSQFIAVLLSILCLTHALVEKRVDDNSYYLRLRHSARGRLNISHLLEKAKAEDMDLNTTGSFFYKIFDSAKPIVVDHDEVHKTFVTSMTLVKCMLFIAAILCVVMIAGASYILGKTAQNNVAPIPIQDIRMEEFNNEQHFGSNYLIVVE